MHANFTPTERHEDRFKDKPFQRPATEALAATHTGTSPRWLRDHRNSWHGVDFSYHSAVYIERYYKRYCETLCGVDESVGRVMAQLRAIGIADETLVSYMSDNGFMFGEHGLMDKRVACETSIRVSLLMRCPALFAGGQILTQVVTTIDIAPTILEAAGLATPPHMDGQSLLPLTRGHAKPWREQFLYVYYWEKNYPQTPPPLPCAPTATSSSPTTVSGMPTNSTIWRTILRRPKTCFTKGSFSPLRATWRSDSTT